MPTDTLKHFSELSYIDLEIKNLDAKKKRQARAAVATVEMEYRKSLKKDEGIKAVTVSFTDIEGRLHMLDFDKGYFLSNTENLTFDGSSIRGFTSLAQSDLRLLIDWPSLRWLPSDVFGPGKVLVFANIADKDYQPFPADFRYQLQQYTDQLFKKNKTEVLAAPEIEGMVLAGELAEQNFNELQGFSLISTGGYFHVLPQDPLRQFIDRAAEAQRALGFENEKDHPEVAPSQFELNFRYGPVVDTCDQIQIYKLVCRQVAHSMGMTATFLPKPIAGINGNGMHLNMSLFKGGKNMFYDKKGQYLLSKEANAFVSRILNHAPELALLLNSSVNAYRRLDPNFEAPNQIKVSPTDRGSMIRIPIGNENSTRIEVRSVAPDSNPYLAFYGLVRTGLEGEQLKELKNQRQRLRYLPGTLTDALRLFKTSAFMESILTAENKDKLVKWKTVVAERSPKQLGKMVKNAEVVYHHEVTNQVLWNQF